MAFILLKTPPEVICNGQVCLQNCYLFFSSCVMQVMAKDADSGLYGRVTYSILHGNLFNQFTINPSNGLISLASQLDREQVLQASQPLYCIIQLVTAISKLIYSEDLSYANILRKSISFYIRWSSLHM